MELIEMTYYSYYEYLEEMSFFLNQSNCIFNLYLLTFNFKLSKLSEFGSLK